MKYFENVPLKTIITIIDCFVYSVPTDDSEATYIGGRSLDITKIIFENEFKQIVIFNKN
ncbi:hypothetical protein M0Q39_05550 [Patescibacteria group bacterium]|nr:hypothetical protein [Patescibacteria group bacterium]